MLLLESREIRKTNNFLATFFVPYVCQKERMKLLLEPKRLASAVVMYPAMLLSISVAT